MIFGVCYEKFAHEGSAPPRAMQLLRECGFTWGRPFLFLSEINPQPGVWNFDKAYADCKAMRDAGLRVYANALWCPAHASEGKPAYEPYTAGCISVTPSWHYDETKEYCVTPPHIDSAQMYEMGQQCGWRLGDLVDMWGIWNEPGGEAYWPPSRTDPNNAIRRLMSQVVDPFTDGVRVGVQYDPFLKFAGPEADSPGVLSALWAMSWPRIGAALYARPTFHPYSWAAPPTIADAVDRVQEFLSAVPTLAVPWITEFGFDSDPTQLPEFARQVAQRYGDRKVGAIFFYRCEYFFTDESWKDGTYVPNETYYEMQKVIREVNERRRPSGRA